MITRRCSQRQFLLRPSPRVNALFEFCLAMGATRYGVAIHAYCAMSSHYHVVCTDERGELPNFVQWFNSTLARALNAYLDRHENFFAGARSYSRVELAEGDDVLAEMVYVLTNPVTAGLVSSWTKWPGAVSGPRQHEGEAKVIERPTLFFSADGDVPESATLRVVKPRGYSDLTDAAFGDLLRDRVIARETAIRAEMKARGRSFLGAGRVKRTPRTQTATSPREERGRINPTVAAHDRWVRIERLQANGAFLAAYREAWIEYRDRSRDAEFPAGTWLMRVRHHVSCSDPP